MRIAILGAGHWHVEAYYIPALREAQTEIVALHDPDPATAERIGEDLDCPRYTDHIRLLDEQEPELVFAHAPHAHMTALAADLVARRQPFHMEKPMGVDWRALDAVAVKADTERVWTAVALVSRCYGAIEALGKLKDAGEMGEACHFYHSLLGGSPLRYRDWGVPWMLDPALAGAGPLWNFGPHIIDIFMQLVDRQIIRVEVWTANTIHHLQIPDIATIRITGQSGVEGVGQVGYVMPTSYERFFSLSTDKLHCGGIDMGSGALLMRDGREIAFRGPDSDTVYGAHVQDCLRRFAEGAPARATIRDMADVLRIMSAAAASMQTGKPVTIKPFPPDSR